MSLIVKICGLTSREAAEAVTRAGAHMAGFVFFEKSPRHLASFEDAQEIARGLAPSIARVALTVDADDKTLGAIVDGLAPDYFQLHGSESPERVARIKAAFGLPVIKVCPISDKQDLDAARTFEGVADLLLFDAKPPKASGSRSSTERPGGLGQVFDWSLLAGERKWQIPWLLAGGLSPENVADAVRATHPDGVDVSTGVEVSPGVKSPELIERFVAAALMR